MASDEVVRAVEDLGFTRVESEVYVWLLARGPASGYAIAQGLGKAAAGVYKVLDALTSRGAASVDVGQTRLYRAAPHEELLASLSRRFELRRERARDALADLRRPAVDDRVYQIASYDAVFDRARDLLGRARHLALADVFPQVLDAVRPDLEAAAARGVSVGVQVYRAPEAPLAVTLVAPAHDGEAILANWRGAWLNLVVDCEQHLLAHLDPDRRAVVQAVWSASPYLTLIYHGALGSEMRARAAEHALATGVPADRAHADAVRRLVSKPDLPAVEALRAGPPPGGA